MIRNGTLRYAKQHMGGGIGDNARQKYTTLTKERSAVARNALHNADRVGNTKGRGNRGGVELKIGVSSDSVLRSLHLPLPFLFPSSFGVLGVGGQSQNGRYRSSARDRQRNGAV
ncbi:hypothetical protein F2P81_022568 [Scophthalmus maximus]|uniref:Uncharacterized protein n=1 Tax=Scophthalmus maximus TaxID=52904 RepID=A0A6A4RYJ7_SCOMX|nr:hypothetical protein F2P81_022568 [Scophthalmus maximus]